MSYQKPPEWDSFTPTSKRRILDAYAEWEESHEKYLRAHEACEKSKGQRNVGLMLCGAAFLALMVLSAVVGPIGHR